jgi:exodeoxyribonuclease VII small subunit
MAKKEQTFEELFAALEERSRRLEQGNLPLEESLKLYEEGAEIAGKLREILGSADLRIRTLRARMDEETVTLREPDFEYDLEDEL